MGHSGATSLESDAEERRRLLLGLRWELQRLKMAVSVRKPSSGQWQLRVQAAGWSCLVQCAGLGDDYVFVDRHGIVLGPANERRQVARALLQSSERRWSA
jgi:hypothetical protein